MSIAYNGMPIGVTASSKIILLTNTIFVYNALKKPPENFILKAAHRYPYGRLNTFYLRQRDN